MKKLSLILAAAFAGFISTSALAGSPTAVYWNFGPPGLSSAPQSNSYSGLTVGGFAQGNNNGTTAPFTSTSGSTAYTTAAGFSNSGSTNLGAAVATGAFSTASSTYFTTSFSLSSSSTLSYTLSDVSFGSRSTGTGPQQLSLYMSTDGFTSDFTSLGSVNVLNNSTWAAIDFSGLSVAIPNDDSTVSFRIYGSGVVGNPTAGTATWRIDDVAFEIGSVPEPSVAALLGLGGLGLFLRRKKNS